MTDPRFTIVGMRSAAAAPAPKKQKTRRRRPVLAAALLLLILLGCAFAELIMTKDPTYMDLAHYSAPPSREFLFGTDALGRDIFSMIWYGGRISLLIGLLSAAISAAIAILLGALSGMAPAWLDALLMRCTEIFLSVPNLLVVLFLQSILGERAEPLARPRRYRLDEHGEGRAHRGAAAPQRGFRHGLKMYGRRLFPCPLRTPDAEFPALHPLYGGYEHPRRDRR